MKAGKYFFDATFCMDWLICDPSFSNFDKRLNRLTLSTCSFVLTHMQQTTFENISAKAEYAHFQLYLFIHILDALQSRLLRMCCNLGKVK